MARHIRVPAELLVVVSILLGPFLLIGGAVWSLKGGFGYTSLADSVIITLAGILWVVIVLIHVIKPEWLKKLE